jgi:hypothetical protein
VKIERIGAGPGPGKYSLPKLFSQDRRNKNLTLIPGPKNICFIGIDARISLWRMEWPDIIGMGRERIREAIIT